MFEDHERLVNISKYDRKQNAVRNGRFVLIWCHVTSSHQTSKFPVLFPEIALSTRKRNWGGLFLLSWKVSSPPLAHSVRRHNSKNSRDSCVIQHTSMRVSKLNYDRSLVSSLVEKLLSRDYFWTDEFGVLFLFSDSKFL